MSVGHVARAMETAGISTVVVAVTAFKQRMEMMSLPRVLLTPHPMGRPIGAPNDVDGQRWVLHSALSLLHDATGGKTIRQHEGAYNCRMEGLS